jgi:DNA-binding CsgD family transcriptional regulator
VIALIAAARSDVATCVRYANDSIARSGRAGARATELGAYCALGLLAVGQGEFEEALTPLERAHALSLENEYFELSQPQWAAELVESLVRTSRVSEAIPLVDLLEWHAERTGRPIAGALAARARAMVVNEDFQTHFDESLRLHSLSHRPFEEARTRLYYGERLRRVKQKHLARGELRQALSTFARLGAVPWLTRARDELEATGLALSKARRLPSDQLTPQELQVSMCVLAGATNREIATRLFLSPKTVEYHLSHVYRKLGVSSRVELPEALRPADHP